MQEIDLKKVDPRLLSRMTDHVGQMSGSLQHNPFPPRGAGGDADGDAWAGWGAAGITAIGR